MFYRRPVEDGAATFHQVARDEFVGTHTERVRLVGGQANPPSTTDRTFRRDSPMRKSNLLVAVAVAGLIGGTTLAGAQRSNSSGMGNGGAGGAAAPSGAERSSPSTDSMGGTSAKPSAEHRSEKGSNAASSEPSEGHNQAAGQGGAAGPSGNTSNAANSGSTAKGGSASLSSEQRTKIHQTIVRQGNAPRVARVDFSVSVG